MFACLFVVMVRVLVSYTGCYPKVYSCNDSYEIGCRASRGLGGKTSGWCLLAAFWVPSGCFLDALGCVLAASWLSWAHPDWILERFGSPGGGLGGFFGMPCGHAFCTTWCMNCSKKPILALTSVFLSSPSARRYMRSTWNSAASRRECRACQIQGPSPNPAFFKRRGLIPPS